MKKETALLAKGESCCMCQNVAKYYSTYQRDKIFFCSINCHEKYNARKARTRNMILISLLEGDLSDEDPNEELSPRREPTLNVESEEIFQACRKNKNKVLKEFLSGQKGDEIYSKEGVPLLAYAVLYGNTETVEIVLEAVTNVNIEGPASFNRKTPLLIAAEKGDANKAQLLINRGANLIHKDKEGKTALHYTAGIEDVTCAHLLIDSKNSLVNLTDNYSQTPLHMTAGQGNIALLRLLMASKAEIDKIDNMGRTPLHWAVLQDMGHCVLTLLNQKGGDKKLLNKQDRLGQAPIHYAAEMNFLTTAKMLVDKGCNIEVSNGKGQTPFVIAAVNNFSKMCQLFVENHANIMMKDSQGWTALHHAAASGQDDLCTILMTAGISLDCTNNQDQTPIFLAVINGHLSTAKIFIKRNPQCWKRTDGTKRTPLHYASEIGHIRIVSLLLAMVSMSRTSKQAEKIAEGQNFMDGEDTNSSTALYLSAVEGQKDCCQHLVDHFATVRNDEERGLLRELGVKIPDRPPPSGAAKPPQVQKKMSMYSLAKKLSVSDGGLAATVLGKPQWDASTTVQEDPRPYRQSLDYTMEGLYIGERTNSRYSGLEPSYPPTTVVDLNEVHQGSPKTKRWSKLSAYVTPQPFSKQSPTYGGNQKNPKSSKNSRKSFSYNITPTSTKK